MGPPPCSACSPQTLGAPASKNGSGSGCSSDYDGGTGGSDGVGCGDDGERGSGRSECRNESISGRVHCSGGGGDHYGDSDAGREATGGSRTANSSSDHNHGSDTVSNGWSSSSDNSNGVSLVFRGDFTVIANNATVATTTTTTPSAAPAPDPATASATASNSSSDIRSNSNTSRNNKSNSTSRSGSNVSDIKSSSSNAGLEAGRCVACHLSFSTLCHPEFALFHDVSFEDSIASLAVRYHVQVSPS